MKRFFSFVLVLTMLSCFTAFAENAQNGTSEKGINIAEYIKRYYQRKVQVCEVFEREMEYSVFDIAKGDAAYIDQIRISLDENFNIRILGMTVEDLSDYVRSIPAIYALKYNPVLDKTYAFVAKYSPAPGYWLTSYEDDFESFKNAVSSPVQWGDYLAIYSEVEGVGPVITFILNE